MKTNKDNNNISRYALEKRIMSNLSNKYNSNNKDGTLNQMIVNALIFNKNSHIVAIFKDSMIWDYIDEFLKRFYKSKESIDRVPKFSSFYKNYLQFFCKPIFTNFTFNSIIQDYNEKRAEVYYNNNFKGKKDEEMEELEDNDDIDEDKEEVSKSKIEKTIFNSTIKEKIENTSIITYKDNPSEASMNLNVPDTINESGLLVPYSNEQSIIAIMNQLNNQKISKPKKLSKPNHITNPSKYISYTNLCQKRNIDIVKKNQTCHTKSQITIMTSNSKTKSRNSKVDKLFSYISKHNTTTTTSKPKKPSHSNTKTSFKTFDLSKQNQKSTINTSKVKSLISHITKHVKNTSINLQIHKKSNHSIDGNVNKSKPKKHISSISSIPTTKENNKNIIKLRKSAKKAPQSSTNDDLMKITLALLMNDKSKYTQSGKQIQNVNININNQININNNLQIPVPFSPKHINTKISHNDKVDMNINSNLTRLLSVNKKSRNKTGSGDINANTYCSFNITDKKSNPTMKTVMKTYSTNVTKQKKSEEKIKIMTKNIKKKHTLQYKVPSNTLNSKGFKIISKIVSTTNNNNK